MKIVLVYDSRRKGSVHSGIQQRAITSAVEMEQETDKTIELFKIDISKSTLTDTWKHADILIFGDTESYTFLEQVPKDAIEKLALSGTLIVLNHHPRAKKKIFPNIDFGFDWSSSYDTIHNLSLSVGSSPNELIDGLDDLVKGETISTLEDLRHKITNSEYVDRVLTAKDRGGREYDVIIFVHYPPEKIKKPLGILWINLHCVKKNEEFLEHLLEKIHRNLIHWWKAHGLSLLRRRYTTMIELLSTITHEELYLAREESRTDLLASEPELLKEIIRDILQREYEDKILRVDFDPKRGKGYQPTLESGRALDLRCTITFCDPKSKKFKDAELWIEVESGDGKKGVEQVKEAIRELLKKRDPKSILVELWADEPLPPAEPEGFEKLKEEFPEVKVAYRCLPILLRKYEQYFTRLLYICKKLQYQRKL